MLHARNTAVQLSTTYTDPEHHNAQTDRQTDHTIMPTADHYAAMLKLQYKIKLINNKNLVSLNDDRKEYM